MRIGHHSIASLLFIVVCAPTAARAEEVNDDDEDFGDELIWIDARGGYQGVDLVAFDDDPGRFAAGVLPTTLGGPALDFGGGLRFWFVTIGPRVRVAMFEEERDAGTDSLTLFSADIEAGVRIPLGRIEPHITLAGGYSGLGGVPLGSGNGDDTLDVRGGNARAGAGLDVYLTENISLGADVTGEVLVLSRATLPPDAPSGPLDGDAAVGGAMTATGGVGFHF